MQFTDHPKLSTLGLPAALQFLTMNDWTKNFERDNLPTIRKLYAANGVAQRVDCQYYDTPHSHDKQKRERTYQWMQRWIRERAPDEPAVEPGDVKTFPVQTLKDLSVEVSENKGIGELSRIYEADRGYRTPDLATRAQWQQYRRQMLAELKDLLGMDVVLPRANNEPKRVHIRSDADLLIEHVGYPSEGGILVPTIVIRPKQAEDKLPVSVVLSEDGHEALFAAAVDSRVTSADVDLAGGCFRKRNLPLVSCVLRYGDVLQWAALVADRQLTLRNVPSEAGDPQWLRTVFALMQNSDGLRLEP